MKGQILKASLLVAIFLPATVTPAHAHGPDPVLVLVLLGSLALHVAAIPAIILLAGIFRGRRMYFLIPYILFLTVWYFAVMDQLPVERFILPIVIIPPLVLAILYVAAWISREQGGVEAQHGDPEGPVDRQ